MVVVGKSGSQSIQLFFKKSIQLMDKLNINPAGTKKKENKVRVRNGKRCVCDLKGDDGFARPGPISAARVREAIYARNPTRPPLVRSTTARPPPANPVRAHEGHECPARSEWPLPFSPGSASV